MRKFKLFLSLLMLMAFSLGNVWGVDYQLVTSTDDLVVGANYVIGTSDGSFIATTTNSNNRKMTSGTITNNVVTATDAMMVFTLGGTSSGWTLYAGNYAGGAGYLNATSTTGSNNVKIVEALDNYAYFTIAITDAGVATITCTGKDSRNILYKNGTTCFSCYNNQTQSQYVKPGLYKEVSSSCSNTVTITKGAETNGTYSLSATSVCGDGEGEDVTISDITPDPGYAFDKITTSASGTVDNVNKKVTGITANTTITVLFKELQKYTVSFNTGAGNPAVSPIEEATAGAGITLPAGPTPACSADGWTFAGWAASAVGEETTTAPTLLSGNYNPTDNVTLYAVYKRTEEGGVADNSVTETFENQTAGSSYNSTQNYEAANSNANIAWTMYYGTVSTNDKITGANSAQMRWYSSATTNYGYIQNTTAISGLQKISFNARVSSTDVKMSVWYSTNGENWTLIDENLTFDAQNTAKPFSSTINGAVGTDYYIRIGVGDGGTAPSSGNYKLIVDDVKFEYKAGASTTYYLSAPSCVKEPGVSVDPAPVAFGDVKQHSKGALDTEFVFKKFTVTGENLTGNITVNAPEGSIFGLWNPETESVIGTSINLTPDANKAVEKELAIMAATGWSGAQKGSFSITGGGLAEDVTVNITMNVTPTFEVAVAVNDGEMGTATINGEPALYTDGNDVLNLVATPKAGYEFVNWTTNNDEHIVIDNANAASTTATADADVKVTANFQAQACTNLAAPTLGTLSKNYEYANITWTAVEHADHYVFNLREHEGDARTPLNTNNLGTEMLNLKANTQYDYTVMAVGDGSTYCDENNALLEGSFTTDDYPEATLTLSENGVERALPGSHKLNDVVTLPTEVATGVVGKVFVGWDANADCATVPAYAKGANYTIAAEADKLYAVYATETPGEAANHDVFATTSLGTTSTVTDGYTISAAADKKDGYYQDGSGDTRYVQVMVTETATQIIPSEPSAITVKATIGGGSAKDPLGNNVYAQFLDASGNVLGDPVVVTTKVEVTTGKEYVVSMPVANYANVRGVRISHVKETSYNVRYYAISLAYTTSAAATYSKYATNGPRLLAEPTISLAAGTYTTAQNVELTAAEGDIYYTLDGTEPTSESDKYTAAIELNKYGEYTLKAIAIDGDNKSNVVSAEYSMKVPFTTVAELISYVETNSLTSLTNVTVTGIISQIDNFTSNTITYWISDNGQTNAFEVYKGKGLNGADFDAITDLTVGDRVTVNGNYTYYDPAEGDPIHEFAQFTSKIVERTAAELSSVVISGEATKTEYYYNEYISFEGLTATAVYNTGFKKDITSAEGLVWAADPVKVTASGNVNVTATYGGKTSDAKVVTVTKKLRQLTDEQLAWSAAEAKAYTVGKAYTLPTLTNTLGLAVTYSSETPATATISNEEGHEGEISTVAAGSTVINAAFAGDDEYAAKEVNYTLTVEAPKSIAITGDPVKTEYEAGESFNRTGLTATVTYTDDETLDVTSDAEWTFDSAVITTNVKVNVTAAWQGLNDSKLVPVEVLTHVINYNATPANGTVIVLNANTAEEVSNDDHLLKGDELIISANPKSGYKLETLTVNGVNFTNNGTYVVGTEDIVIVATFVQDTGTALDNTEADENAAKVMLNGQLLIMKNGKTYNAQGQLVK